MAHKPIQLFSTAVILLFIVIGTSINAYAQIEITKPIEQLGFNKNTIVTNDKGVVYKYNDWHKLILTGNYKLHPVQEESDSSSFILVKKSKILEDKLFTSIYETMQLDPFIFKLKAWI